MMSKRNSLLLRAESVSGVGRGSLQPEHSLIQIKALTPLRAREAERHEEAAEARSEHSGGWFMRLQERNPLHSYQSMRSSNKC